MKFLFFSLTIALGMAAGAMGQNGSTLMTGSQTQTVVGQKVFYSGGNAGANLIGWSQSGASAGMFLQDSHFENPAVVIQRKGVDGDTASTPALSVIAGRETAFDGWVFVTHGCTVTGGDNSFLVANSGGFASSDGAYDLSNGQLSLGRKSVDFNKRNAIGDDGVTAKITWNGDSVRIPGQTLLYGDSAMTWSLADGRYATLTKLGAYSNSGGTISNNNGTIKNSGILDNFEGYSITFKTSGTVLMRAEANALYDPINTINSNVQNALNLKASVTDVSAKANATVVISAGAGLTGGGDLTTGRTISIDYARANTWAGKQTFASVAVTGTSWTGCLPVGTVSGNYTLTAADCGTVIRAAGGGTITLPGGLPVGFNVKVIQESGGQVTFAAGGGATLASRQGYTKTAGQWAVASLIVSAANNYVLSGDVSN